MIEQRYRTGHLGMNDVATVCVYRERLEYDETTVKPNQLLLHGNGAAGQRWDIDGVPDPHGNVVTMSRSDNDCRQRISNDRIRHVHAVHQC